ncbi:MAG: glycosyltransferase family 2 protein [Prolixibacteraceae bacterium]|nr:glycosyltransferase family 2 protein [Prolixibacteraceae bacterium]
MTEKIKIAVVILNWNGKKLFDIFLPSVIQHTDRPDTKIFIADNGSTDSSVEYLQQKFTGIEIIDLEKNHGFAKGYNLALKQIDAKYFVLLNSDVMVSPEWLDAPIKELEENENTAAVQPKILSYNEQSKFEYAGAAGGFIDIFGYPFCRGRILNRTETDHGQYNKPTSVFWASGACMFIRSDAFKESGGFDEDFMAHMEEIDLCWRLKNRGSDIKYQPASIVYHLGGGTMPYNSPQKVFLNFRNNLFMLCKNLSQHKFHRILITRILLDWVAAAKFILGLSFTEFSAIIKAHIHFCRKLNKMMKKRKELSRYKITTEHPEIYRKSIMWKFFIQGKAKFSDLDFNL